MSRPTDISRRPDPSTMTFGEHLEDLRRRIIFALIGIVPIFLAATAGGGWLIDLLIAPAQEQLRRAGLPAQLQSTGPLETIGAYLKVAVAGTLVVGLPWIIYQIWLFVEPGLYPNEKRFARLLLPLSAALTVLGLLFLYYVMLPAMLLFLINFGAALGRPDVTRAPLPPGVVLPILPRLDRDPQSPPPGSLWFNRSLNELRLNEAGDGEGPKVVGVPLGVTAGIAQQYRIGEYTGLIFFLAVAFALGFQTPVAVLLLGWLGIVDRAFLARRRKYAVFAAAVVAAVLTPSPDPFSMLILAGPLYVLYELGLFMLKVLPAGRVARGFTLRGHRFGVEGEPADAGDA
jgi:sec-independent protein translocase protein TatC